MNRDPEKLGPALRQLREESSLLARDVAAKAGFSPSYLSELEKGTRRIGESAIEKLASAFDRKPAELQEELAKRAVVIREEEAATRKRSELIPFGSSSRLHEAPVASRAMSPTQADADVDALALLRFFVASMSREELFALHRRFMAEAEAGDTSAFARARALFELIPPEVLPVEGKSG